MNSDDANPVRRLERTGQYRHFGYFSPEVPVSDHEPSSVAYLFEVRSPGSYSAPECLPSKNSGSWKRCLHEPATVTAPAALPFTSPLCRVTSCSSGLAPHRTGTRRCSWSVRSARMAVSAVRFYGRIVPDARRPGTPSGRPAWPESAVRRSRNRGVIFEGGDTARPARLSALSRSSCVWKREGGKKSCSSNHYGKSPYGAAHKIIMHACRSP